MITIFQWNCRGLSSKLYEFSNVMLNFDVGCLQETWLNHTHILNFKNYICFRNDRTPPRIGGGTLIVCKAHLDPISLPIQGNCFKGCEYTSISIKIPGSLDRVLIISIYRPPDARFDQADWSLLLDAFVASGNFADILVLGDLNAQHSSWGSSHNNFAGTSLFGSLPQSPYIILNNGCGTRVSANINHISCPDITLFKPGHLRCSWSVEEEPMGSDHLPIIINATINLSHLNPNCEASGRPRLSSSSLDRKLFYALISSRLAVPQIGLSGIQLYQDWIEVILDCCLRAGGARIDGRGSCCKFDQRGGRVVSFKLKDKKSRKRSKPWWDRDCQEAVNFRKQCYLELIRCPGRQQLLQYRRASNKARSVIRKRRRVNFNEFVDSLDPRLNSKNFWKTIKLFRESEFFSSKDTPSSSKSDAIDRFIEGFAPAGTMIPFPDEVKLKCPSFFDMPFQLCELEDIISSTKQDSAPGCDLINYRILKLLPTIAVQRLLEIFNKILYEKSFPEVWRVYDIVLLPKPGREDYRPIALSSCILKLLEKLIKIRLDRFVELDLLLPSSQFGFRKGKSCDDCLSILMLEIYRGFTNHEPVGALFLDIKGAYDNVNPGILFDSINAMKIPVTYKRFIRNLICFRKVNFYQSGSFRGSRTIFKGLPQGSALSPLLFNLYIKDILKHVPCNCKSIQFADDILLLCSHRDMKEITNSLQIAFNQIHSWLYGIGLELSLPKCKFVVFHCSRKDLSMLYLNVGQGSIPVSPRAKYLGIWLDSGLRWRDHIGFVRARTSKYVNILKWLVGRSWGISPLQAINFVNATIVAQLLWGAAWFVDASDSRFKVLDSIVISAYKIAMSLPRSASNKSCWAFSTQPTLKRRIHFLCDLFILKAVQLNKSIIINKIKNINNIFAVRSIQEARLPFIIRRWRALEHLIPNLYVWRYHPHYEFPLRPRTEGVKFDFNSGITAGESGDPNGCFVQLINDLKIDPYELSIYTDGSRMSIDQGEGVVGCAVVAPSRGLMYQFKLNNSTSSYSAELIAIQKAIDITKSENWSSINVCSDSLSALTRLESVLLSLTPFARTDLSPLVMELALSVSRLLSRGIGIRFTWCPAHKGIEGNELADFCAKAAGCQGITLENTVSFREIISALEREYKNIDVLSIDRISRGTGSYYMSNFREINVKFLEKLTYKRRGLTTLIRVLLGYSNTYKRLFKMGLVNSPACPCGFQSQDLNHLFWACPNLNDQRRKLLRSLYTYKLQSPFSLEYLLGNINKGIASKICDFVVSIEAAFGMAL